MPLPTGLHRSILIQPSDNSFPNGNFLLTYTFCSIVMTMLFPLLSGEFYITSISRLSSGQCLNKSLFCQRQRKKEGGGKKKICFYSNPRPATMAYLLKTLHYIGVLFSSHSNCNLQSQSGMQTKWQQALKLPLSQYLCPTQTDLSVVQT